MIPGLPGVRLWIWPTHRLEAFGRAVPLTRREGDVMAVLASDTRRFWHREELVEHAYSDPDDEPEWGADTIRLRIWRLRRKFHAHGLTCRIDARWGCHGGYRLAAVEPLRPPPLLGIAFPAGASVRLAAPAPAAAADIHALPPDPIAAPGPRPSGLRLRGGGFPPSRRPGPLAEAPEC